MSDIPGRFSVETVVKTPRASVLYVQDITEFLAACKRHGIGHGDTVKVEHDGQYFCLIGTKSVETQERPVAGAVNQY